MVDVAEPSVSSSSTISPHENVIFRARPTNSAASTVKPFSSANIILVANDEAPPQNIISPAVENSKKVQRSLVSDQTGEPTQGSEKPESKEEITKSGPTENLLRSITNQEVTEDNTDSQNPKKYESQSATIIGTILGIVLLAVGGIVFYKAVSRRKNESSSVQMKDGQLDLRYSLDTSENLARNSEASSNDYIISVDNKQKQESMISEKDSFSNSSSQQDHSEVQLQAATLSNRINSEYLGTPEEKYEILDIARSAQEAALTEGYFKSKYQGHDSIVSFDSLA